MSVPVSQSSRSEGPPKVPIPRIQTRHYQQLPRRANPPYRDKVLIACTSCRERKVRCDGGQPRCRNCLDGIRTCVYLDSRRSRFKAATKHNQDMINFLKQLRGSITDRTKQQLDDLLDRVTDDVSDATGTLGLERSSDLKDTHGEAEISAEVGSNDETDILDENILQDKDSQATGYVGKSSEVQWLRRLQREMECREVTPSTPSSSYGPPGTSSESAKRRMEAMKQRQQRMPSIPTSTSTFYLDVDGMEVDYAVEPYKLPTIEVAQRLLDRYMSTVQDTFPVLSKQTFTDQVRHYYTSVTQGTPYRVPEKWLAILNFVFAIGARFSHLTEADWQADSRDHIVYQSRAHMLNLDEPSLVHQPDLMRVQITALFAFYSSTVGNINRAWVAIGIALRYAVALGLHLRNEDPTMEVARKEALVHIWWALQILEGNLSIMLGRPSLVVEDYFSTPLPLPVSIEKVSDEPLSSCCHNRGRGARTHDNTAEPAPTTTEPCNSGSLLRCMAKLTMIGQRAMIGVYSAKLTAKSWKDMQGTIASLCGELETWAATLPSGLNFAQPNSSGNFRRERLIVHMSYIRVKIIITRPCLCRLDSRIPNQTKFSDEFNKKMARVCVNAAKELADILSDQVDAAYLYQIGPWWSMTHHLMQSLTVLLLELSYSTVDISGNEDILSKIKTLIRSLRILKKKDRVAERAYDVAFGVLQSLAFRLETDISDLLQEDDASFSATPISQHQSVIGYHERIQQSLIDEFNYNSGVSHQSTFAFPLWLNDGDSEVPKFTDPAENPPLGLGVCGPPFSNPFETVHNDETSNFSEFLA